MNHLINLVRGSLLQVDQGPSVIEQFDGHLPVFRNAFRIGRVITHEFERILLLNSASIITQSMSQIDVMEKGSKDHKKTPPQSMIVKEVI
ncbi:MAG TPA: hypothetical protein DEP12_00735 [Planctomycetaceae bacterium]|nr:hypothetical protein [Planctomycetaceae bacterium]